MARRVSAPRVRLADESGVTKRTEFVIPEESGFPRPVDGFIWVLGAAAMGFVKQGHDGVVWWLRKSRKRPARWVAMKRAGSMHGQL
jgi:hypothetical protein